MRKLCTERWREWTRLALFLSSSLMHSIIYRLRSIILSHKGNSKRNEFVEQYNTPESRELLAWNKKRNQPERESQTSWKSFTNQGRKNPKPGSKRKSPPPESIGGWAFVINWDAWQGSHPRGREGAQSYLEGEKNAGRGLFYRLSTSSAERTCKLGLR